MKAHSWPILLDTGRVDITYEADRSVVDKETLTAEKILNETLRASLTEDPLLPCANSMRLACCNTPTPTPPITAKF